MPRPILSASRFCAAFDGGTRTLAAMLLGPVDQILVAEWLRGPVVALPYYADLYAGARQVLGLRPPGYVAFVSHAGREIMNGIVREQSTPLVEYAKLVGQVAAEWEDHWGGPTLQQQPATAEDSTVRNIPAECCTLIGRLVVEHRKGTERNRDTSLRFFTLYLQYREAEAVPADLVAQWSDAREWFAGNAHLDRRTAADAARGNDAVKHFAAMERGLLAAARDTTRSLEGLNAILDAANR